MNSGGIIAFVEALYGAVFEQGYHVVMLGIRGEGLTSEIAPRRCTSIDEVVAAVEELGNQQYNVYYPMALIRADRQLEPGTRGTADEMDALIGFHVDLDLRGEAHPKATIPDIATALAIIDAFEVPPSFIIFTGHGIQAVWLFKEPLTIEEDADRKRAKLLVRRFVATIAALGRMNGGHFVDSTGDLARVLRMPGTINRKVKDGVTFLPEPTRVLRPEGSFDGNLPRYNPDDLEPLLVGLAEDDAEIDYSLVGTFKLDSSAVAPPIVEQLCQRRPAFAQLWRNDPEANLHDHSTSGYRYAMMGYLVRAHAADQEIADAICAWYAKHHPAYDKHHRRPALIAHEIAKQRTRHQKPQSNSGGDPAAKAVAPPAVDGPCGIQLIAVESKPTAAKRRVRFEVHLDGTSVGEILVTDSGDSGKRASDQLDGVISDARGRDPLPDAQRHEVHRWLRGIATAKRLDCIVEDLEEYQKSIQALETVPLKATVHDITVGYMMDSLGLAFREPGNLVWSETRGESISRNDILNYFPQELLEAIKGASNYAKPTAGNTTKHIHHLQLEYKSVWTTIITKLPTETEAQGLGPKSKAATRLRSLIGRLWETPEVWAKAVNAGSDARLIDRISLAGRAQEMATDTRGRSRWTRIVRGADAFVRVEPGPSGDPVIWLGMRATLCQGAIKGIKIPGMGNQHDLRVLMDRYGLSDQGSVSDRLHREDGQKRVCVLSRQLTDELISGADGEDDEARGTEQTGDSVPRGGALRHPIPQYAEVANGV